MHVWVIDSRGGSSMLLRDICQQASIKALAQGLSRDEEHVIAAGMRLGGSPGPAVRVRSPPFTSYTVEPLQVRPLRLRLSGRAAGRLRQGGCAAVRRALRQRQMATPGAGRGAALATALPGSILDARLAERFRMGKPIMH
jgi:hypothetical protein